MVETKLDFDADEPGRKAISPDSDPSPEDLPVSGFECNFDGPVRELPPIFKGAGGVVVSRELVEPLLRFDLGRTLLLPLRLLRYDRKTEFFEAFKYNSPLGARCFGPSCQLYLKA